MIDETPAESPAQTIRRLENELRSAQGTIDAVLARAKKAEAERDSFRELLLDGLRHD